MKLSSVAKVAAGFGVMSYVLWVIGNTEEENKKLRKRLDHVESVNRTFVKVFNRVIDEMEDEQLVKKTSTIIDEEVAFESIVRDY